MSNNSAEHINQVMNEQVSNQQAALSNTEAGKVLGVVNNLIYIDADTYIGKPEALLGTTFQLRKVGNDCPSGLNAGNAEIEFMALPISGAFIDPESRIKDPIKRQSIMIDQKTAAQVSLLTYLSAKVENEASFSIMVFDQAAGLVNIQADSWKQGLIQWKKDNDDAMKDDSICYLFAVIGFVQKYIISKKFTKFTGDAKGGGFGVNLGGQLYVSNEDYSLGIRYGLQTVILKRPGDKSAKNIQAGGEESFVAPVLEPGRDDLEILRQVSLKGSVNTSKLRDI